MAAVGHATHALRSAAPRSAPRMRLLDIHLTTELLVLLLRLLSCMISPISFRPADRTL